MCLYLYVYLYLCLYLSVHTNLLIHMYTYRTSTFRNKLAHAARGVCRRTHPGIQSNVYVLSPCAMTLSHICHISMNVLSHIWIMNIWIMDNVLSHVWIMWDNVSSHICHISVHYPIYVIFAHT